MQNTAGQLLIYWKVTFPAGVEYLFSHKQDSSSTQQAPKRRHQEGLKWEPKSSWRGYTKCSLERSREVSISFVCFVFLNMWLNGYLGVRHAIVVCESNSAKKLSKQSSSGCTGLKFPGKRVLVNRPKANWSNLCGFLLKICEFYIISDLIFYLFSCQVVEFH